MVIWRVASPVAGRQLARFKYRLFFGDPGHRFVCYDNERGKGDHKHVGGAERSYKFVSIEALIGDFVAAHPDGGICVPYDIIHAGFDLKAAA